MSTLNETQRRAIMRTVLILAAIVVGLFVLTLVRGVK
jgi:hypothetical protein